MNLRSLWISPFAVATLCVATHFVARAEDAPQLPPVPATQSPGTEGNPQPATTVPTAPQTQNQNSTELSPAPAPIPAPVPVAVPQPEKSADAPIKAKPAGTQPAQLNPPESAKPVESKELKTDGPVAPPTPEIKPAEKLPAKPVEKKVEKSTADKPAVEKKSTIEKPTVKVLDKPATGATEKSQAGSIVKPIPPKPAVVKPRDPLLELVDRAIMETGRRRLTAGVHTPWQIVHGILAYRWDFKLVNPLDAKDISAVEWMFSGQTFDNEPLWLATPYGGRGHPYTRPYAFEGHPTQFMGYMTMANIPLDYEIQTPDRVIKVRDVINDAKMAVKEGPEVTWTLWAVSHYEEPDAQWMNAQGEPWSIEKMVQIQVNEPVTSGACGGTHGLFALAYSRNIYLSTGKPLRGVWLESDQKIKKYVLESQYLQNSDGSLSANYFQGGGYSQDFVKRITTSGHQLEWLMVAMPQSKLKEAWIRNAIRCVAQDLIDNRRTPSDCGPMYHAVDALTIYRQRMLKQYLFPRRNSPMKLTERKFHGQIIPQQSTIQAALPYNVNPR